MMDKNTQKSYEEYRIQWMLGHGFTLTDFIESLAFWEKELDHPPLKEIFENWEAYIGFGGEIWPCFDEFLDEELVLLEESASHLLGESPLDERSIYERFKLQWMLDHNHSMSELVKGMGAELQDYLNEYTDDDEFGAIDYMESVFADWQCQGFHGEIWVSPEEFEACAEESKVADAAFAVSMPLPDGTSFRAQCIPGAEFPCINIFWDRIGACHNPLCFAELDPEEKRAYVGVYRDAEDDLVYYAPNDAEYLGELYTTMKLTWEQVSEHIGALLSRLLHRDIRCWTKAEDDDFWDISVSQGPFLTNEIVELVTHVGGNESMFQENIPEDSDFSHSLGIELCRALLKEALSLDWEVEMVKEDALWITGRF